MSGEDGGSRNDIWDFPGGVVVETSPSNAPFLRRGFEWANEGENKGAMNRLLIILKREKKLENWEEMGLKDKGRI